MKKVAVLGALMLALVGAPTFAHALSLDNWNVPELDSTDDAVIVTYDAATNTLTYTFSEGAVVEGPTPKAIVEVGYSSTVDSVSESGGTTAWVLNLSGNEDGFGFFPSVNSAGPGNETSLSISFVLAGDGLDGIDLSTLTFVAHVQYNGGCSGWVSNGTTTASVSNPNCSDGGGGSTQVPEPAIPLLLGTGLAAVAAFARRRLKK